MAVRGRLHAGATRWFCAEQAEGVARPAEWWFAVSFDRTWSDGGADVRGNRCVDGRKPSSQLAEWSGEWFALSTDCGVCAARAVDQACTLSEYLPWIRRIEARHKSPGALRGRARIRVWIFKKLFSTSLIRERPGLFYSEAQLRKDGVWRSEPLEQGLSLKRSQNRL